MDQKQGGILKRSFVHRMHFWTSLKADCLRVGRRGSKLITTTIIITTIIFPVVPRARDRVVRILREPIQGAILCRARRCGQIPFLAET